MDLTSEVVGTALRLFKQTTLWLLVNLDLTSAQRMEYYTVGRSHTVRCWNGGQQRQLALRPRGSFSNKYNSICCCVKMYHEIK